MVIRKRQKHKQWYQSEDIRRNVLLGVTAAITLLKFFGYDKKFGLGTDIVSSSDLTEVVMFAIVPVGAGLTALWVAFAGIRKRVRDGKNPAHPDLPIAKPRGVQATEDAVKRFTS